MSRALALLLTASLTAAARGDAPKPNTLTEKEVSEGWILLFDGESTFGWQAPTGSKWTVFDGMLAPQADKPGLLVTTTAFGDYELKFDYQVRATSKVEVRTCCEPGGAGPAGARLSLMYLGGGWCQARCQVRGGRVGGATFERGGLGTAIKTTTKGDDSDKSPRTGHLALAGNAVIFRTIKLRPLNTKPIFDGKTLAGWKAYDKEKGRSKSKFAVTKEGWLNVKDGPGDLQTTGEWADFVLQLECVSNGKHLNSGLFFRCKPGEYQQGYEAQIRNQFTDKPTQKYAVEDYDPKTHKLLKKREVTSTAVDYGTGAIYRRVPARKGVAKDKEWFTLTVVAHGRHMATWVNGVQVVDWTDNRPAADNGRNGYRAAKGPISIQGHDPTTDLSFRNLRVADLAAPAKKE